MSTKKTVPPKLPKRWIIVDLNNNWVSDTLHETAAKAKTAAAKLDNDDWDDGCYCVAEIACQIKSKNNTKEQEFPVEYV